MGQLFHSASLDSMLSVYIVDSFDDYECLREDSCSPHNQRDFNVSSGVQESLNETFSISSYYFIVHNLLLMMTLYRGATHMKPQASFTTILIILCPPAM